MTQPGFDGAVEAVLVPSNEVPEDAVRVVGPRVMGSKLGDILAKYHTVGYQATNYGIAVEEVKAMLQWRLADDAKQLNTQRQHADISDEEAKTVRTKVFLGACSSLLLSGVRESIRYVCEHKMVHVVVTPGGGIDSDLLRTLDPSTVTIGQYNTGEGSRQGNLQIASAARDIVVSYAKKCLQQLVAENTIQTPSGIVRMLGKLLAEVPSIDYKSSVLYWCSVNEIPVYCPSIVDGWVGEAIFELNEERLAAGEPALRVDLIEDVKGMNTEATSAKHTGMVILGGGVVKHHICNANLMRNGADHSIFIGTGQEFDGSDAGARPDEAVSWGKIRPGTKAVKVYADASLVFPLLVAQGFAPYYAANKDLYP